MRPSKKLLPLIKINTQNNVNKIDTSLISKTKFIESILTSVIVKLDKYMKLTDTMLCIKILLAGEEILLVSDKIPIINIKKPHIVNKIKLLKNKIEQIASCYYKPIIAKIKRFLSFNFFNVEKTIVI